MYDIILYFNFIFWLSIFIVYLRLPCASIFHPATYYLAFHGLVFAVRPLFQSWWNIQQIYDLYQFSASDDIKILSLLVANVGLISFMAFVLTIGGQPFRFLSKPLLSQQERPMALTIVAFLICLPLIVYSFNYSISKKFVDPTDVVAVYRDFRERVTHTEVAGYIVEANIMLGSFGCIIAWSARFKIWSLIPFLLFVGLRMVNGYSMTNTVVG